MKKFCLFFISLLPLAVFSQSYFVLDSGVTLTIDHQGYVYDTSHFTPLNRVTIKGGQYLVEESNVLVTVNQQGELFRKYEIIPKNVLGKGMNYIIGEDGSIITIDLNGEAYLVERDEKLKDATKFGGNFFVINEEIYTVNFAGEYRPVDNEGPKTEDILILGGNYFMTNRGVLYTVSQEGKIESHPHIRVGIIAKKGGNYFVDSSGLFYSISKDGTLILPDLPVNLRPHAITRLGSNYLMDGSGKLFTVDAEGNVYERWSQHDLRLTKIISL
jgi:hypothetical protein